MSSDSCRLFDHLLQERKDVVLRHGFAGAARFYVLYLEGGV